MNPTEFCYWLQGYFELRYKDSPSLPLTREQTETIERHLALVFKHSIDPTQGTQEHQAELQSIHDGKPPEGITYQC